MSDGVDPAERDAAEALIYIARIQSQPSFFRVLMERRWLESGSLQELAAALLALESLAIANPAAAGEIAAMPFLDTLESPDLAAIESLANLAYADRRAFQQVIDHGAISDGIDDREANIVALLWGVNRTNPDLMKTLLDFSRASLEERMVNLPRAGRVKLVIIRTSPGAARSMDLLEHSVRNTEDFIGEPFPQGYVALLFENAVPPSAAGANFGTHMAILPRYDVDNNSRAAAAASRIIAHEVAHYYWNGSRDWLDEGAADFSAAVAERDLTGRPLEPYRYPCGLVDSIKKLEAEGYSEESPGFSCNYSLGERLFLDLYRGLGEDDFREGFRRLYRSVDSRKTSRNVKAGIEEVRQAFQLNIAGREAIIRSIVNNVIRRWYDGV